MKTEIFATFGPACRDETILKEMIDKGMTGMRWNLSHTTLLASETYIKAYQKVSNEVGVNFQILIDMQGPELRVGELKESVCFEPNEQIILCSQKDYDDKDSEVCKKVSVPEEVIETIEAGDEILFDDGKILGNALGIEKKRVFVKMVLGGKLEGHKSIKIKGKNVKMPPLTLHDIENIKLAKEYGVTALMQPFVLSGDDLKYVRKILKENGAEDIQIFAKLENRLGVENIENIIPEADVIIIARGDLGNDMPLWELPVVQKQIENTCRKYKKPYIVVTQMLASMEENPIPTRAEISDIFHAVYHGAWGVMITGETAVGKHPVEAVRYLANTAKEAENFGEKE